MLNIAEYKLENSEIIANLTTWVNRITNEEAADMTDVAGMRVMVIIDSDGSVVIRTQFPHDRSRRLDQHRGLVRTLYLPQGSAPHSIGEFLTDHMDLLIRVVAGMSEGQDSSGQTIGLLSDDGEEALDELYDLAHEDNMIEVVEVLEAREWLDPVRTEIASCDSARKAREYALEAIEQGEPFRGPDGRNWLVIEVSDAERYAENLYWSNADAEEVDEPWNRDTEDNPDGDDYEVYSDADSGL